MSSLDCVVAYRLLASFVKAIFSSHAVFAVWTALSIWSAASARDLSILLWRMPVRPRSSSTSTALSPCSSRLPSPRINAVRAPSASVFHISANESADIPATSAKLCKESSPVATAFSMALSVCVMAVPPASASMPTEDIAAASAMICGSVNPASLPPEARRVPICVISDSVVAKLLPRSTITAPRRS